MRNCLWLALLAVSIVLLHGQDDEDLFDEEHHGMQEDEHDGDSDEEYEDHADDVSKEDLHTLHGHFDSNNDGKVSLAEILEFHSKARKVIAASEVEDLYGEALAAKGGMVSLEEYLEVAELHPDNADAKKLEAIEAEKFAAADVNKDGSLDKSELANLVDPVLHAQVLDLHIKGLMQTHDKNHDGKLSADEWQDYDDIYDTEFKHVDANHDGSIDMDELKHHEVEGHLNNALRKLLEDADKDGDKHFSKDELGNMAHVMEKYELEDHIEDWLYHYLQNDRGEM